jgi:hypothetical protein
LLNIPLNIITTPQIADITIAFITKIYAFAYDGCLIIILDKIVSTLPCVSSRNGLG